MGRLLDILKSSADILELLYPSTCLACQNGLLHGEEVLCLYCQYNLFLPFNDREVTDKGVLQRLWGKIPINKVYTLMKYKKGGAAQELIRRYKYDGYTNIGKYLGRIAAKTLDNSSDYVVIPIPLHKSKLKKRGFNQAAVFAESLAHHSDQYCRSDILVRQVRSQSQTSKTKFQRWENVDQVFTCNDSKEIQNKNVLLVDDILTTGATLESASNVLMQAGVKSISIFTIAISEI